MKKKIAILLLITCTIASVHAVEKSDSSTKQTEMTSEDSAINPKTGFPEITDKPFAIFNEGITFSQITRIVYQSDYNRSNFVWQDYMTGMYCELQTVNMKPVNSLVRIAAYYPFWHTFNGMDQAAKQALLYGVDLYAGPLFETDMWKYVRINYSFGPHFLYELSDEYHHLELGGASLLGIELPVATRWTILLNGMMSVDYGNLGTNKIIQPYDMVWNYQMELGVRYSKKNPNTFAYVRGKTAK